MLVSIAKEKINLAESILKDETENYSFGKINLNDYIQAVNTLDDNRFNLVSHDIRMQKLALEWRRLADELVVAIPA
jgi:outer membrane protein TolC